MSAMGYTGKTTNQRREVTAVQAQAERESMWGEIDGEIVSFDPSTQTATIQPLYRPLHRGEPVDMPQLLEVPVRFARAGGGGLTYPISAGDRVTLRPKMRSSENYHSSGDGSPADVRSFSLSDMEAHLDGGESLGDPIPNFDPSNVHIRFDTGGNYGMRGSPDGKIAIEGSAGNIYDLLVQVVEILGGETTTVASGSSAGVWPLTSQGQFAAIAAQLRSMAL